MPLFVMDKVAPRNQRLIETYFLWKRTPFALQEPKTKAAFARKHGLHEVTLQQWDKLLAGRDDNEQPPATEHEILMMDLKNRVSEKDCPASVIALYVDLKGYRTKEKEAEIVLTADDIIKASIKADKYLRNKGYAILEDGGMAEMQKKP